MSNNLKRTRQAALLVVWTGVFAAIIAGISVYAQEDPDRQLYDNDILFQQLSSGAQMRLIAKFGPKPAAPIASPFNSLLGLLQPATPPPNNVLVSNLAEDTGPQDTQSETTLVLGSGANIVVGFNDSGSAVLPPPTNHFT